MASSLVESDWKIVAGRIAKAVAYGAVGMLFYVLMYLYLLPRAIAGLTGDLGSGIAEAASNRDVLLTFAVFFLGLSAAARALRGSIYQPLLHAISSLVGFFVLLYFTNGGVLESTIGSSGGTMRVMLDISPVLYVVFFFMTVPGIIIPFIEYFLRFGEEEG